jgi:methyl-accepting chemotaxis protein
VNEAVAQLDQMTQQNAALVEESAAAAQSAAEQSRRLIGTVSRFKVDGRGGDVPAAAGKSVPQASQWASTPAPTPSHAASAVPAPIKAASLSPKSLAGQTVNRVRTAAKSALAKPAAQAGAVSAPRAAAPAPQKAAPAPAPAATSAPGDDWETF